jgi:hypothetical protein
MQISGYPVRMLNTQYRMHPDISVFPSRQFYGGGLLNGEVSETCTQSGVALYLEHMHGMGLVGSIGHEQSGQAECRRQGCGRGSYRCHLFTA